MKMYMAACEELAEFLTAQGIAIFIGLTYDFLKGLKPQKLSKTVSDFFDLLVLLLLIFAFCIPWQKFLAGRFRWYAVLGFAITLILYFLTIHKPVFTAYCIINKKISAFFGIIFKFLLTVWAFLVKITLCISVFCKKMYIVDCKGKNYEEKGYQI